ncbi:annexin A7-like isoform X1 [Maniola jurtina]|uniref:annexin A7-like isoform X1 n=1 Tax=Maniola jurtina TaxID=191418 RepID=UPI001E68C503|nr:annexin A7-like isoform X1 [Maniola jurtina]XP_045767904.1 annexin A7-like isoform X1 [Maniola jurtina]
MSGYPYGGNPPQYPPPQGQIYPQIYNPANAPPPAQNQYQPGYAGYPNQPATAPHPAAMTYPGGPAPPSYGYPGFGPLVEWIPSTPAEAYRLGDRAVVAGYEGYDQSPLWVIRSRYEGDLIPGKLAVKHQAAYVPWGGRENQVHTIEVCCARPDRVRWVENRDGVVPPNAIVGGNTAAGEPLYIGRAREQGSLTPGKVHPSHGAMYVSFAGKEIAHKHYEILVSI